MKKGVPIKYINLINDMYDEIVIDQRVCGSPTSDSSITIGLHQGSALSQFLFTVIINKFTRTI